MLLRAIIPASVALLAAALQIDSAAGRAVASTPAPEECSAVSRLPLSGALDLAVRRICSPDTLPALPARPGGQAAGIVGPNQRVTTPAGAEAGNQSEPHLAVSGTLLCSVFNDYNHAGGSNVGFARKQGAAGWDHSGAVPRGTFGSLDGDPALAVDRNGVFHVTMLADLASGSGPLANHIAVSSSSDCSNWTGPASASGADAHFLDKPWSAADLRAGAAPAGNIYLCWTNFQDFTIRASHGPPGTPAGPFAGPSPSTVPPGFLVASAPAGRLVNGCQVAVTPNGNVYFAWSEFDINFPAFTNPTIFFRQCSPGLLSCEAPVAVTDGTVGAITAIGTPDSGCGIVGKRVLVFGADAVGIWHYPSMAVGPSGDAYIAWNDARFGDADILFAQRAAGGGAFTGPVRLNQDTAGNGFRQFMPAIAAAPDGTIEATWYDERNAVGAGLDMFASRSANTGATWFERRVSLPPGVPFPAGGEFAVHSSCYIGDYNGIVADDSSVFHMVWGDKRDAGPDENIYYDFEARPVGGITFLPDMGALSTQTPPSSSRAAGVRKGLILGTAAALAFIGGVFCLTPRRAP